MMTTAEILEEAIAGKTRFLARTITLLEIRDPSMGKAIDNHPKRREKQPGSPRVVGITGAPGAGKSTWVDCLIRAIRNNNETVAVVAIDPSSPFSGGAILGDRIRMETHTMDKGVYMRSLSSRGHLGGLSAAANEVVNLLDIVGFDWVIVETVGVGQSELSIMEIADSVVVLVTPESGDSVQAMKAGLFEVADMFLINKADRPGADAMARDLAEAVSLGVQNERVVPVLQGSGLHQEGVEALISAIQEHVDWCNGAGREIWSRRRGHARERFFLDLVMSQRRQQVLDSLSHEDREALRRGSKSPYALMEKLK